jgi:hypothetical protein
LILNPQVIETKCFGRRYGMMGFHTHRCHGAKGAIPFFLRLFARAQWTLRLRLGGFLLEHGRHLVVPQSYAFDEHDSFDWGPASLQGFDIMWARLTGRP